MGRNQCKKAENTRNQNASPPTGDRSSSSAREQGLMEDECDELTESGFRRWIIRNFCELKEHVLTQCKETKNLERRFNEMLTRMDNLEKNISELMELKNTIRELRKACTSFNSRIDQAEERISEVEDQLNEIKREGKMTEKRLLGRLREENCLNPGGRGCSKPRPRHCSPAWVAERYSVKEKKKERKKEDTPETFSHIWSFVFVAQAGIQCAISAHSNLCLPGSRDSPASASQGVTLLPRLECSGMIMLHCSLDLLDSSDPPYLSLPRSWDHRQDEGLTMLPMVVLNSWAQGILMPQCPKVLGLQTPGSRGQEQKDRRMAEWCGREKRRNVQMLRGIWLGATGEEIGRWTVKLPGKTIFPFHSPSSSPSILLRATSTTQQPPEFILQVHGLILSPRLQCSGVISAHGSLDFLSSGDSSSSSPQAAGTTGVRHHAWIIFYIFNRDRFHHVVHAGLELLGSSNLPASASQSAGIIGVSHCVRDKKVFCKKFKLFMSAVAVAHTYNPSILGGRGRQITRPLEFETSLANMHFERQRQEDHLRSVVRDQPGQHRETPSLLKIQKCSQEWWCAPVVPAIWEAEAGELLEPRRQKLQDKLSLFAQAGLELLHFGKPKRVDHLRSGVLDQPDQYGETLSLLKLQKSVGHG
ncbi:LINE-1 retrotransposable element ORF1 protein, partial [Plecturocebus cupreus]